MFSVAPVEVRDKVVKLVLFFCLNVGLRDGTRVTKLTLLVFNCEDALLAFFLFHWTRSHIAKNGPVFLLITSSKC